MNAQTKEMIVYVECKSCRCYTEKGDKCKICGACRLEEAIEKYGKTISPYDYSGPTPPRRMKDLVIDWEERLLEKYEQELEKNQEPDNELLYFKDKYGNKIYMTVKEHKSFKDYYGKRSCLALAQGSKGNIYEIVYKRI